MLTLPMPVQIHVATQAVDMRCGFDGLSALTRSRLKQDPLSGHVFVFWNRRRDRVKCLLWQRRGFVIVYKRLERGCFQVPVGGDASVTLDATQLWLMLEGIDVRGVVRQPVWQPPRRTGRGANHAKKTDRGANDVNQSGR